MFSGIPSNWHVVLRGKTGTKCQNPFVRFYTSGILGNNPPRRPLYKVAETPRFLGLLVKRIVYLLRTIAECHSSRWYLCELVVIPHLVRWRSTRGKREGHCFPCSTTPLPHAALRHVYGHRERCQHVSESGGPFVVESESWQAGILRFRVLCCTVPRSFPEPPSLLDYFLLEVIAVAQIVDQLCSHQGWGG